MMPWSDRVIFLQEKCVWCEKIKLQLTRKLSSVCLLSSSLPETFPGLEQPLPNSDQHALVRSQPSHTPAVHIFRELHTPGPQQPERPEHTSKEALDYILLCVPIINRPQLQTFMAISFTKCSFETNKLRTAALFLYAPVQICSEML